MVERQKERFYSPHIPTMPRMRSTAQDASPRAPWVTFSPVDRLVVVGGPGSGKSTLAIRLADALSAAHVELDSVWWQARWVHLEPMEFSEQIGEVLRRSPRWVVDGNYVDEIAMGVWPLADTLVWLDLPRWRAFLRAVMRSARRVVTRQELWNGNRERLEVLSPRSLGRLWRRWPSYSERIESELSGSRYADHLAIVHLKSPRSE